MDRAAVAVEGIGVERAILFCEKVRPVFEKNEGLQRV